MNILTFIKEYPDEKSCREHFRKQREQKGVKCKRCLNTKHCWLEGKEQWQCSECKFRTTLRSGTKMEPAKLPVRTWYLAMAILSFSKKGIPTCELQCKISHKRYASLWSLMHKIREAMGKGDDFYSLKGMIEMDEGNFEIATKQSAKFNRGRGSQKQQMVSVFAESTPRKLGERNNN